MNNDYNFSNGNNNPNDFTQPQQPQQQPQYQPSAQSGFQPQQPNYNQQYTQPQQPAYTQPQYEQPAQSGFQQYQQPQQPAYNQPQYQQNAYNQNTYDQGYGYAQPNYNQGYEQYYAQPNNEAELNSLAGSALTMGILSVAFSEIPLLNIAGIIFGAIGKGKANRFNSLAGRLFGKAKVGAILAKIGMILSIVCCGIYAFAFMIGFIEGLA